MTLKQAAERLKAIDPARTYCVSKEHWSVQVREYDTYRVSMQPAVNGEACGSVTSDTIQHVLQAAIDMLTQTPDANNE